MSEETRSRGVKCLVKRKICVERNGKQEYLTKGIHTLTTEEYEHYCKNRVVTKDIILDDNGEAIDG